MDQPSSSLRYIIDWAANHVSKATDVFVCLSGGYLGFFTSVYAAEALDEIGCRRLAEVCVAFASNEY